MTRLLLLILTAIAGRAFAQTTEVNVPYNFNRKVRIVSPTWDDHLEISRTGWGGIFKPDASGGHLGLRLDLIGAGSSFYVMDGNVGIGTTSPDYKLHIKDGNGGAQLKFQRGTGIARFAQDNNQNNLYLDAPAGLFLNYDGGPVGIGTNAPQGTVHIKAAWPSVIIDKESSSTEALLRFSKAGNPQFYFWSDNLDNDALKIMAAGLSGEDDSSPRMEFPLINKNIHMVESGGNVGIGTTSPDHRLHIKDGNGGAQLKFQRGTGIARVLQDNNQNNLYIEASAGLFLNPGGGNVGIGTTSPDYKLHIKDGNGGAQLKFQRGTGIARVLQDNNQNNLYIEAPAGLLLNPGGGNVGIGTTDPGSFKLAVNGKIWTQEVNVAMTNPGPDYVFEEDYKLLSLAELEAYIKQNKHLPEVPSAKQMDEEGLNLKEMNLILLKKVEELTLHLIEMKKENDSQNRDNLELKQRIIQVENKN